MAGHSLRRGDDGFLVLGWLAKCVIIVSLCGIMLFDGIAMIRGHIHTENTAQAAAQAAVTQYTDTHDYTSALEAARTAAAGGDDTLPAGGFIVGVGYISVTLDGHVDTLILGHIPGLSKQAHPTATVRQALPTS